MANRIVVTVIGLVLVYAFFQTYAAQLAADNQQLFRSARQGQDIMVNDTPSAPGNMSIAPANGTTPAIPATDTTGSLNTTANTTDASVPANPIVQTPATPTIAATPAPEPTVAPAPVIMPNLPSGASVDSTAIILGYHQFVGPGIHSSNVYVMQADVFESEMKYLHDSGYNIVPLADVMKYLNHEGTLPPRAVVITIDDGYKSPITWAMPILKKYNFPWTFFVYPQFISDGPSNPSGRGAASWQDLLDLQNQGVDIECHSYSHPIMTKHGKLSEDGYVAFLLKETAGSKAILEQKLGKPVPYFAYPYGDYNKVVEAATIAAGYKGIFTVAGNPVHSTTPWYRVGRYIITKVEERSFAAILREGALAVANAQPAPGAIVTEARPTISAILTYAGQLKPSSISADVKEEGGVRCDFDAPSSTVRVYLLKDLLRPGLVSVTIHAEDAQTSQHVSTRWQFDYEPVAKPPVVPAPINARIPVAPAAAQ